MAEHRWVFTKEEIANTPSRKCGIESDKELNYRQQAANLIQDMGQQLQVTQLCINTAIVYMHRFYMFHSFTKFHRNALAATSLFLAAKVEEQPRKLEHVIRVCHRLLNREAKPLDTKSEAYLNEAQELVVNENMLLQTLGFDITVDHPHGHVVRTCSLVKASKDLAQTSYFLATNSLHLTPLCLLYKATVVACVCMHLACKWSDYQIPRSSEGKEWYYYVDREVTTEMLEELTQDFLAILDKCPSKLKKKILTWKAGRDDPGGSPSISSPAVPPPPATSRSSSSSQSRAPAPRPGEGIRRVRTEPNNMQHLTAKEYIQRHQNKKRPTPSSAAAPPPPPPPPAPAAAAAAASSASVTSRSNIFDTMQQEADPLKIRASLEADIADMDTAATTEAASTKPSVPPAAAAPPGPKSAKLLSPPVKHRAAAVVAPPPPAVTTPPITSPIKNVSLKSPLMSPRIPVERELLISSERKRRRLPSISVEDKELLSDRRGSPKIMLEKIEGSDGEGSNKLKHQDLLPTVASPAAAATPVPLKLKLPSASPQADGRKHHKKHKRHKHRHKSSSHEPPRPTEDQSQIPRLKIKLATGDDGSGSDAGGKLKMVLSKNTSGQYTSSSQQPQQQQQQQSSASRSHHKHSRKRHHSPHQVGAPPKRQAINDQMIHQNLENLDKLIKMKLAQVQSQQPPPPPPIAAPPLPPGSP